MRQNVVEEIDSGLQSKSRIDIARSQAHSVVISTITDFCKANTPNVSDFMLASLSRRGCAVVDKEFENWDYTKTIQIAGEMALHQQGWNGTVNAGEILQDMSPESLTNMACQILSALGASVAKDMIKNIDPEQHYA